MLSQVRDFAPLMVSKSIAACSQCSLSALCMPLSLSATEMARLDKLIGAPHHVPRRHQLYHTGELFNTLFVVKSGSFKTDTSGSDGYEQVVGFQMVGDLLGMDGISREIHTCNAVALEDSQVCAIHFAKLEILASEIPRLQRHFHKLMSREIVRDHGIMMLLGTMCARERLAAFLLNLSQRFAARGYSPTDFHLRMTREEIGSYLGLKLETVSRAFSSFQDESLITVNLKHILIIDMKRLKTTLGRATEHYQ
jgi:CRP/FNR family transcriptional regulator